MKQLFALALAGMMGVSLVPAGSFYAEDMVHLSNQGIAYIWEKFQSCFIASSTQEWMQKIERCNKILAHRPFDENSESAMELYLRTQNELKEILDKLYTEL